MKVPIKDRKSHLLGYTNLKPSSTPVGICTTYSLALPLVKLVLDKQPLVHTLRTSSGFSYPNHPVVI